MLHNNIPLAGGWLRTRSALMLIELSRSGDRMATRILAKAVDSHNEGTIRGMARRHLSSELPQAALNAAWQVWYEDRGKNLSKVLLSQERPATSPPQVRLMSALALNLEDVVQGMGAELVPALYAASQDRDATIASRARFALAQLKTPNAISTLCRLWEKVRDPLLESTLAQAAYQPSEPAEISVLVALKFNRLELVTRRGADGIPALLVACADKDEDIRARACFCLVNLQSQPAINALCAAWLKSRDALLEGAIIQARYVAAQPYRLRIFTALKAGRIDLLAKLKPEGVAVLLEACADNDHDIRTRAETALRALETSEAREALCTAVMDQEHALARSICLECSYLPEAPERRALFLFLTEQWDAYERLDFDQRLLNAVYETSSAELRQRVLRRVQQAGRTSFLNIVTNVDDRARAGRMSSIEAQLLARVLAGNAEWQRLWVLAQSLALAQSVEIVRRLEREGWQPADALECETFSTLARLAHAEMLTTGNELHEALPMGMQRAVLRVHGRVNATAFAPDRPQLAIGSGGRRVALWNYHTGSMERLWKDFSHSIGEVDFTPAGQLLCAERSTLQEPCAIYALGGDAPAVVGQHNGPVTALLCLDDEQVLSAGRDLRARLWNLTGRSLARERRLADWPRAACLSPDHEQVLLLHSRLEMLDARTLDTQLNILPPRGNHGSRSVLRSAAFLSDTDQVLAGQFNGQVVQYMSAGSRVRGRLLAQHAAPVECVQVLPGRPIVASASADRLVRFYTLPELRPLGQIEAQGGRLTSLHASPDGAFLAIGTNQSRLELWDLRVLDIPSLFNTPVANILPSQMALVNTLAGYTELPDGVRAAIGYLQCLLQNRFRYDIELAEAPVIRVGEFDVFLD